jgi:alkanesulfonate monooxygenase SsuD/methylene tetrahydromethanopterin reductase-like flavin-dependent oxidoreductase (luciferase family)
MTSRFRLGFLTHVEGHGDLRQVYRDTLELFIAADELGFDVGWVAQHHFKRAGGSLPSPFPFLAAAAERTRTLRLGTAVVVLPLELPLRVAEDAAVVDALSGGRLELGVGSGLDHPAFAAFGVDINRRQELTKQGLQIIQRTLRGEELGGATQQLQPPAPTLADRLWQGTMSVAGAQHVAEQGVGIMLARAAMGSDQPTDIAQLPLIQAYNDAWGSRPEPHRVALSRGIYPAIDKRAALDGLRGDVLRFAETIAQQNNRPLPASIEEVCQQLHIAYGHPDEVAATLAADKILPYATDLIVQFNPAIPSLNQALWMLEQVATQIAPALGWQPSSRAAVEQAQVPVEA